MNKVDRRRKWKEIFVELKGNRCAMCGITVPQYAFDLHHLIEGEAISDILRKQRWDFDNKEHVAYLYREVSKCVLLCSNCHRACHHHEDRI